MHELEDEQLFLVYDVPSYCEVCAVFNALGPVSACFVEVQELGGCDLDVLGFPGLQNASLLVAALVLT